MSTPTTATATLPPHHRPHHHPPSHYHHQHYPVYPTPTTTGTSYRSAAPSGGNLSIFTTPASTASTAFTAAVTGRPTAQQARQPHYLPPQSSSAYTANSVYQLPEISPNGAPASLAPARHLSARTHSTPHSEAHHTNITLPSMSQSSAYAENQPNKKRRSKEPDWKKFYKNGLPKEIIVIDDTPEPETKVAPSTQSSCRTYTTTTTTTTTNAPPGNASAGIPHTRHITKKRRKEEGLHNEAALYEASHNGSTHATSNSDSASTDRATNYTTTAPTSLSSAGQYEYEAPQTGQKRKRTRQQIAQDAKRREIEVLGDGFQEYQPPAKPIKKSGDVAVRAVNDRSHPAGIKVDDDDGHYIVVPDAELTSQYQIVKLLGQGTFGKVVQALDRRRNNLVAIKIIRAVQKYRDASRIELRVLQTLKANDAENRNRCIHLRDCFDFRGHICIVMDLLGSSVFDFLKSNNFVPFPNSQIQSFARQLLTSVAFLHDLNLIHTDLKPENILLCDNAYQTFTYNRRIPSSANGVSRQATQRKVLLDTEIRLIDFGSATFDDEYHSSVVSTRHYRAPEIILGLGWSFPCDIWSIGCILVEFFTGDALFQTHDNLEHLAMMENVCDSRIDPHLVQMVNKSSARNNANSPAKYFKRLKLDYPSAETTRASRRFVRNMKRLSDIIPSTSPFLRQFLDLLQKIFVYDPAKRISAREALTHPWFREPAIPDDGTEAIKIRLERMRESNPCHVPRTHAS
ncbi:kinase-like domain-containing protein [Xylariaceae sp. FL0594]|nr:kinase-like domain-containing protein [Xylariaceae sp. FL0594]